MKWSRVKSIWWKHPAHTKTQKGAKHILEEPEPLAVRPLLLGALILFGGLPILALPSRIGMIPHDYPPGFFESSALVRYLICLLGSFLTFLPWKPPWEIPTPKVVGTGWQILVALIFLVMVFRGVTLVKRGWTRSRENKAILERRDNK